ncbi:uncharacterized protein LOC131235183 [Magnolia sinica]|uniref:uncharacterized protein LOC131235183 n=1 Tax=Magnolia sinica TaxID=86752 RepID=UPI0026596581|nr:uncharacterized protein LOC131235183 [Magnolia sinica]XP_058088310.1 uncharacterized protein LOC131235183 [Magnolia sinica]
MATSTQNEYSAFEDKVRRTVFLDNLSPQVTLSVLKTALGQFGNVVSTQFIPNYTESRCIPQCALVEMETVKQAKSIIAEMTMFPFMMSGMPRPIRARPAEVEMFSDRPARPSRRIECRWVETSNPDCEVGKKFKNLTQKHATEASLLLKYQLEQEEKLATQQREVLKGHYKKYDMLNGLSADRTLNRLAQHYHVNVIDD